ncbi:hypothetical protein J2Y48_003112 [Mycoplana sp. BE70]|nr:hypothetical protein [Mycoplana sp. BE70]
MANAASFRSLRRRIPVADRHFAIRGCLDPEDHLPRRETIAAHIAIDRRLRSANQFSKSLMGEAAFRNVFSERHAKDHTTLALFRKPTNTISVFEVYANME